MTDKLNIELDGSPLVQEARRVTASLEALKAAVAALSTAPTNELKQRVNAIAGTFQTLGVEVKMTMGEVVRASETAMKQVADVIEAGVKKGLKEAQAEASKNPIKIGTSVAPIKFEDGTKVGLSRKGMGPAELLAEQARIQALPGAIDARAAALDALRAKSASAPDARLLLGLPSRDEAKSLGAQLAAQMRDGVTQENLRAKSASAPDARLLLGLPSRDEAKSSGAQLAAQMRDGVAQEGLRAKSASAPDARLLLGLPSRDEAKSLGAQLAAQMRAGVAVEVLRAKSASAPDARTLLGIPSAGYSARASAETFLEAGMMDKVKKAAVEMSPAIEKAKVGIFGWGRELTQAKAAADTLHPSMEKLTYGMREMHSATRGLASGVGAMWLTWGSVIPLMAGAALSGAVVQAVKLGSDVGQSLAKIQHLAGASTTEIAGLNAVLLETSRSGPFGPVQVAKALETLALAGLSAKEQISALKPVLDFAVAGDMPIEKAAESLVAISKAFGYEMSDLSVVSDVVAKTAAISMATTEGMASSFRVASVIAQQYKVSLTDVATVLGLLAQVGIRDQAAGTATRQMYSELVGSSAKARAVMQDTLKFDAFTEGGKALKPLTAIVTELSASFLKLDFKSQLRVLQDLGNERGTKGIAATLEAVRTAFDKSGKSAAGFVSELQNVQDQLADAPGFSAIAAIGISGSSLNQMKTTMSTLQAAMVEAFQAAEPAILRVSAALQDIFKSDGFREGVKSLVSSVADLTRFLVSHIDTIVALTKAYVVFQVGMVTFGLVAAAGSLATNTLNASFLRATVGAVALRTGIATIGVAATATAPALLSLSAAAGWIGLIAVAATSAYAAYKLYFDTTESGTERAIADSQALAKHTTDGLDAEIDRLKKVIAAKGDMKKADELAGAAAADAALARVVAAGASKLAVLEEAKAELTLAKARAEANRLTPGAPAFIEESKQAIAQLDAEILSQNKHTFRQVEQTLEKFETVKRLSREAAALAKPKGGPSGGSGKYDGADGGGSSSANSMKVQADNEMALLVKRYKSQTSVLTSLESDKQRELQASLSSTLITQGQFYAEELKLAEQSDRNKLGLSEEFRRDYMASYNKRVKDIDAAYVKAEAGNVGKKHSPERSKSNFEARDTALENLNRSMVEEIKASEDLDIKAKAAAATRMTLQQISQAGAYAKMKRQTQEFWESEALEQEAAARATATEDLLRFASPEDAARITAVAKETERWNTILQGLDKSLRESQRSFDAFLTASDQMGPKTEAQTALEWDQYMALVAQRSEREKMADGVVSKSKSKGDAAALKAAKDDRQRMVESVGDAITTGIFEGGKAGSKKLRDILKAELRKPITVAITALVNTVFDNLFGKAVAGGGAGGGVGGFFEKLLSGAGTSVAQVIDPTFGSAPLWDLFGGKAFANGTDYVPHDMIAMVHQGEKITTASRNAAGNDDAPRQNIVVNQNFTVGDVASVSMVRQAVAGSEKRIAAGFGRSKRLGGVAA